MDQLDSEALEALRHVVTVVIAADGLLDDDEVQAVAQTLEAFGVTDYGSTELDDDLIRFDRSDLTERLIAARPHLDDDQRIAIFEAARTLARSDGEVDDWEASVVRQVADALEIEVS